MTLHSIYLIESGPSLVGEEAMVLTWAGCDSRPVQEAELPDDALLLQPSPQAVPVHVDRGRLQQGDLWRSMYNVYSQFSGR